MGRSVIEYAIVEHAVYTISQIVKTQGGMSIETVYLVVRWASDESYLNAVKGAQVFLSRDVVAGEKTN